MRTIEIWASGKRAGRRSAALKVSSATSKALVSTSMTTILPRLPASTRDARSAGKSAYPAGQSPLCCNGAGGWLWWPHVIVRVPMI